MRVRQTDCRGGRRPGPPGVALLADVDHARGGRCRSSATTAPARSDAAVAPARRPVATSASTTQVDDLALDHPQVRLRAKRRLHRRAVERAVGLGARTLRRRALAAVQQAELDAGARRPPGPSAPSSASISRTRWPLPSPPIAGLHDISPSRSKRWVTSSRRARPCRAPPARPRAGVAAADDDHVDIAMFHVKQSYLPRQKLGNTTSSTASTSTFPIRKSSARSAARDLLRSDLGARRRGRAAPPPRAAQRRAPARPPRAAARATPSRRRRRAPRASPRSRPASRSIPAPVSPDTASPSAAARRSALVSTDEVAGAASDPELRGLVGVARRGTSAGRPPRPGCRARSIPSASSRSPASRRPAVSSSVSGRPSRSIRTSITSRVVPATSEVSATSRPASAFSSVDLPTFGGPTSATSKPSRIRSATRLPPARAPSPPRSGSSPAPRERIEVVRQLLVGEVDRRLDERQRARPAAAPQSVAEPRQRPVHHPQRLPLLRRGLGREQVAEPLDLRQVEPAVEQRPPGELAGLRRPQPGDARQRLEHRPARPPGCRAPAARRRPRR